MMTLKRSWLVVMAFLMMGQSMPVKAVGPGMFDGIEKVIAVVAVVGVGAVGGTGIAIGKWAANNPNHAIIRKAPLLAGGFAIGAAFVAWLLG